MYVDILKIKLRFFVGEFVIDISFFLLMKGLILIVKILILIFFSKFVCKRVLDGLCDSLFVIMIKIWVILEWVNLNLYFLKFLRVNLVLVLFLRYGILLIVFKIFFLVVKLLRLKMSWKLLLKVKILIVVFFGLMLNVFMIVFMKFSCFLKLLWWILLEEFNKNRIFVGFLL